MPLFETGRRRLLNEGSKDDVAAREEKSIADVEEDGFQIGQNE
jgi:hypothetical protein